MSLRSYRDLDVWQRAVDLAVIIDRLVDKLVRARRFAMADQLSRAALSVSSNIAEGNGRVHRMEYAHHVSISRGSLLEVESVLHVAIRTNRLSQDDCAEAFAMIDSIGRMLTNLLRALYRRPSTSNTIGTALYGAKSRVPSP